MHSALSAAAITILLCGAPSIAQAGTTPIAWQQPQQAATAPSLEQRVAEIKASLARSQATLRSYEWMETTIVSLKGEEKSRTVHRCYYGAEGKIQKIAVEAPQDEGSGRGLRGRIKENKKEEMADYVQQAVELVKHYVPPAPERVQSVLNAGRASLQLVQPDQQVNVALNAYHKTGDSLTIMLDIAANRLLGFDVQTYLDESVAEGKSPKDPVSMKVRQSAFPDGTVYTDTIELETPSKHLTVVVQHSGYRIASGHAQNLPGTTVSGPLVSALSASTLAQASAQPAAGASPEARQADAPPEDPSDVSWPREFESEGKRLTVYQPQVDEWKDYKSIVFRCAIAVEGVLAEERFGVAEIEADTIVDHARRMVALTPRSRTLRFGNTTDAEAEALTSAVNTLLPQQSVTIIGLDKVLSYLDDAEARVQQTVDLNLAPPTIYHSSEPAVLVIFIGKPRFEPVNPQSPSLQFAINTNWDVLYDASTKQYYLLDQDGWITTSDPVNGTWAPARSIPITADSLPNDDNWSEVRKHIPGTPAGSAPKVYVSSEPAELILTDGAPELEPIPNTTLSRVSNTESILFKNAADNKFYFLVAGRWFSATKLDGPWTAASSSLPSDFAAIPDGDESDFVKASVPGTQEAKDAVLLASVPNTTTVSLTETPVQVVYNGEPKFVTVTGTPVQYAVNTSYSVFNSGGQYYCCDQGVWFVATSPTGPWTFATSVPEVIYTIPPSNPHYNVTYVTVQEATPTSVTYSQTSGYSGEYVASTGVLMFGVGLLVGAALDDDDHYYYPPYPAYYSYGCGARYHYGYGGYYAAAHVSYGPYGGAGRAASYNPATGTYARSAYAYGPYASGRTAAAYNPYTGARAAGRQVSTGYGSAGRAAGYNPTTGNYARGAYASGQYGSAGFAQVGNARTGQSATVGAATGDQGGGIVAWDTQRGQGSVAKSASGDIYASHDGTVYKRGEDGSWSSNSGSGWQSAPAGQPRATPTTQTRPTSTSTSATRSTRSLDTQAQARERGNTQATRTKQFQSSGQRSRSSGGRRR